jgi:hypothetical protein
MKILVIFLVLALSGCVDNPVPKEAFDKATIMCEKNDGLQSVSRYTNIIEYVVICKNSATFEQVSVNN